MVLHTRKAGVVAETAQGPLNAEYAVLCTNGFEKIVLRNEDGNDIDTSFHHTVRGSVGYMAGYWQEPADTPTAISYLTPEPVETSAYAAEPYVYMTRRPADGSDERSLLCIGGPEALFDDTNDYAIDHSYPAEAKKKIKDFAQRQYAKPRGSTLHQAYQWHGLMGYTPNGIRLVGKEPSAPRLYYNLGCNGVGILPSVAGGLRIARLLNYEPLPPSIFDPRNTQRVMDHRGRNASRLRALGNWLLGWRRAAPRQSHTAPVKHP
jgi:glycine/D-amino acid oxidase-like deaminating enzyme